MSKREALPGCEGLPSYPFLSAIVRAGDYLHVSGQAGFLRGTSPTGSGDDWSPGELISGGVEAQTRQTLENIKCALERNGSTLEDVVKVDAFLRDIDRDFSGYNDVYMEYFPKNPPARTTVGARIYGPILVEIACLAYRPVELAR